MNGKLIVQRSWIPLKRPFHLRSTLYDGEFWIAPNLLVLSQAELNIPHARRSRPRGNGPPPTRAPQNAGNTGALLSAGTMARKRNHNHMRTYRLYYTTFPLVDTYALALFAERLVLSRDSV